MNGPGKSQPRNLPLLAFSVTSIGVFLIVLALHVLESAMTKTYVSETRIQILPSFADPAALEAQFQPSAYTTILLQTQIKTLPARVLKDVVDDLDLNALW